MPKKTKDPYLFKKKMINSIPVYYNNLSWSPCVHIGIGFKKGALADPIGKDGLAHFLEHLGFNGSKLRPTKKAIRKFSKTFALDSLNARTGFWYTEFTAKCLPKYFTKTMTGILDLIFNPILDPKETEREKGVILQESWDIFRNKKYKQYLQRYISNIQPNLPSRRMYSPIGWPETIATISKKDAEKFHKDNYHSGNMYIILTGAIEEKNTKSIERMLQKIPHGPVFKPEKKKTKINPPIIKSKSYRSDQIGSKQDHATYSIAIKTTRISSNDELYSLVYELLHTVLFETLREEMGLSYGVHVGCHSLNDHVNNYISLDLKVDKIKDAEKAIWKIIKDITHGKYRNKFEEQKRISIDNILAHERTASVIIRNASREIINDGYITTEKEQIKNIKKVTFKDVTKYISKTFKKENVYIEKILP